MFKWKAKVSQVIKNVKKDEGHVNTHTKTLNINLHILFQSIYIVIEN